MTSFFTSGLSQDLEGNYKGAIDFYIESIENEELELDAYLNLIGILIEVSIDYGISSSLIRNHVYSENELNDLYRYLGNLIKKSEIQFSSNEIEFWKYYKENYFTGLQSIRIKEFIKMDDSNLIPYFQLYIDDLLNDNDTLLYKHKIEELKQLLYAQPTIRNKYILSLLTSAENQKRLNQNF